MLYRSSFLCLVAAAPLTASAVEVLPSQQAFSGLLLTPNAQVLEYGDFSYTFGKGQPHRGQISDLDSLLFAVGVMPGLEANGRIVTQTYDCNIYFQQGCGIRDLSASAKYQLPQWISPQLNLAIGVQDLEGAANNFGVYYGVADYQFESLPLRISAGYGSSDLALGVMDGAFGGIEYQPFDFVQLVAEHDGADFNAAAKLFTPQGMLPYGIQLSAGYQLHSEHKSEQDMWQASVSVPMLGFNASKAYESTLTVADKLEVQQRQASAASINNLITALEEEGFINLRVGLHNGQPLITFENRRYNHNPVDGLGVALGIISSYLGDDARKDLGADTLSDRFVAVQLINGEPMLAVRTGAKCYREFLTTGSACGDLSFADGHLPQMLAEVAWQGDTKASSFGRSQLIVMPMLRHAVATEYGVFDYSLAIGTNLYTNLWKGAAIDLRYVIPVATSDDYDTGYWRNSAHESELDRALVHQAFRFGDRVTTQFSAGMIFGDYLGGMNETRWTSPTGRHSFEWELSTFDHQDKDLTKDTFLGRYSLQVPEWSWQIGVEAGDFWNGDQGVELTSTHWLGDVAVTASYLNSKAEDADVSEEFVSLAINIPLTLWRDMKPRYLQVRGTDQFTFNVQTRINENKNTLNSGMGSSISLQHRLGRQYYNRDRFGQNYYQSQLPRLRSSYLRYLDEVI